MSGVDGGCGCGCSEAPLVEAVSSSEGGCGESSEGDMNVLVFEFSNNALLGGESAGTCSESSSNEPFFIESVPSTSTVTEVVYDSFGTPQYDSYGTPEYTTEVIDSYGTPTSYSYETSYETSY